MRRANARNPKCGEIGRGGKNLGLNSLSEAPLGQANRLHERESPDGCEWLTSHKCDQVALRWNTRTPETDDRGRIRKVKREGNRIKKAQNTRRHGRTGARGVHGFDLTRPSSNSKVLVGSAPVSRMHLPGSLRDVSLQLLGWLNARIIMTHKNNMRGQLEQGRNVACICGQTAVQCSAVYVVCKGRKGGRQRAGNINVVCGNACVCV